MNFIRKYLRSFQVSINLDFNLLDIVNLVNAINLGFLLNLTEKHYVHIETTASSGVSYSRIAIS